MSCFIWIDWRNAVKISFDKIRYFFRSKFSQPSSSWQDKPANLSFEPRIFFLFYLFFESLKTEKVDFDDKDQEEEEEEEEKEEEEVTYPGQKCKTTFWKVNQTISV